MIGKKKWEKNWKNERMELRALYLRLRAFRSKITNVFVNKPKIIVCPRRLFCLLLKGPGHAGYRFLDWPVAKVG